MLGAASSPKAGHGRGRDRRRSGTAQAARACVLWFLQKGSLSEFRRSQEEDLQLFCQHGVTDRGGREGRRGVSLGLYLLHLNTSGCEERGGAALKARVEQGRERQVGMFCGGGRRPWAHFLFSTVQGWLSHDRFICV